MQARRSHPAETLRSPAAHSCLHKSKRGELAHKDGGESLLTVQHSLLPGFGSGAGDALPAREQAPSAGKAGKVPQIHLRSLNIHVCDATEPRSQETPRGGSWGDLAR